MQGQFWAGPNLQNENKVNFLSTKTLTLQAGPTVIVLVKPALDVLSGRLNQGKV